MYNMNCTKCGKANELAKGKRWCKICKNQYEKIRRQNLSEEKKQASRDKEKTRYLKNKEEVKNTQIDIDITKTKVCSVCNKEKTLDNFYIAKCKGTVRAMCKYCSSLQRKDYYKNNTEQTIITNTQYQNKRMQTDVNYKLERRLRSRIYTAFTSQSLSKNKRTWDFIDLSTADFRKWMEMQLYDGMTMENYGKYWHIDHVIPCSSFDLSDEKEAEKCFNWKNLRPYLALKNIVKSNKINSYEILMQEIKVNYFEKVLKSDMGLKSILPVAKGTTTG